MKAQKYLQQVEMLNVKIENKLAEKTQWKNIALGTTAHSEGERVQSSGSQQKMADAIGRCVDIEREIDELVDRLIDKKQEIIKTIECVSATEYDVLHKRYVQGMTFDEIGAAKNRSKSWATTVHGRALVAVQRVLDAREVEENAENAETV